MKRKPVDGFFITHADGALAMLLGFFGDSMWLNLEAHNRGAFSLQIANWLSKDRTGARSVARQVYTE
jgi:hypothetical protein